MAGKSVGNNTHGGSGRNQGRHKVDEPRNVVKQVRWTKAEWAQVVAEAKTEGKQPSVFIRDKVLNGDKPI